MKLLAPTILAVLASPVLAHVETAPHVHTSGAAFVWGLGVIAAAATVARVRLLRQAPVRS